MSKFLKVLLTLVMDEGNKSLSHRKVIAIIFVAYTFLMLYYTYKTNNSDLYTDAAWYSIVGGALGISYIRQLSNIKSNKDEQITQ